MKDYLDVIFVSTDPQVHFVQPGVAAYGINDKKPISSEKISLKWICEYSVPPQV